MKPRLEVLNFKGIRGYWRIGCASGQLRDKPLAVQLLDRQLVLFRDAGGAPRALLDRCCHRGVELSLGWVNAGLLECGYHGWRFDGAGRCVHAPSLVAGKSPPSTAGVPAFACVEQDGYVWVRDRETEKATPIPTPMPEFERHRWRQGTLMIAAAAHRVLENNLDWSHPAYAHPWTHGQFYARRFGRAEAHSYEIRLAPDGYTVFAPPAESASAEISQRPAVRLTFTLPDRIRVEFHGPIHMLIYLHAVPTGERSCRLEWQTPRLFPFGPKAVWKPGNPLVFRQDRRLLESAERNYLAGEEDFERSVPADASTMMLRLVLRRAAEGAWDRIFPRLARRRIVEVGE